MIATRHRFSTYANGQPYKTARGKHAYGVTVEDYLEASPAVVQGRPSQSEFIQRIVQELKLRF